MTKRESPYIKSDELSETLGISLRAAQNLVKTCNDELKAKGYVAFKGRCPREYVYARLGLGCDIAPATKARRP